MSKHIRFLLLLMLLCPLSLLAQEGVFKLRGQIWNNDTGQSVELAAAKVFLQADSTAVGGGLTDAQGRFSINLPGDTYYLELSYLGFATVTRSDLTLSSDQPTLDLGRIEMTPAAVSLDAVEIEAEAAQMELKLDKRVFRVDQDLTLAASSADEILQNLPSVQVDAEGGVSLRGSQNVRILINGKPSGMVGIGGATDGLRNLPAELIEKIEVITNPSARYDAEGEVGIINIILKKEDKGGFNGSFNSTVGWPHNHRLGANLNYRSGKFNFFTNLSGNYRNSPGGGGFYQEQRVDGVPTFISEQDNTRSRSSLGGNLRVGADWSPDTYNSFTFAGLVRLGDEANTSGIFYRDFDPDGTLLAETDREQLETETDQNLEFSLNHRRKFAKKEQEWSSTIQYQLNNDTELADITEALIGDEIPLLQRSNNTEDEANWLIQSDYVQPFGAEDKLRFEVGTRITLRTINNEYLVEEKEADELNFKALPNFDNDFLYQENIYAAYGIFSQELQKFSYQFGLRAEYTDIGADTLTEAGFSSYVDKQYLNWFPSAFFSYKLDGRNTVQLSYSRRLSRPRFRNLLPFSGYNDRRNLRLGNPDLDPEYTHSTELGYLAYWDKGSLLSSVYYRYRTGVIERITFLDESGVTFRLPVNLSVQQAAGFELSGSQDLTPWWNISGNVNAYGFRTEGEYEGQDFFAQSLALQTRLNSRMTFWKKTRLQLSGNYMAPQNTAQGRRLAFYSMDLGLSRPVLKGKGTLVFSVRDVFNSRKWREVIDQPDFYRESEFQWRVRQMTLTFTYRLKQEERRERGGRRGDGGGGFGGGDDY